MTDSSATYRHDITGLVGVFDRRLGDNDPHLIEVAIDAKPLAYAPIPHEAVKQLRANSKKKSDEDTPLDKAHPAKRSERAANPSK